MNKDICANIWSQWTPKTRISLTPVFDWVMGKAGGESNGQGSGTGDKKMTIMSLRIFKPWPQLLLITEFADESIFIWNVTNYY